MFFNKGDVVRCVDSGDGGNRITNSYLYRVLSSDQTWTFLEQNDDGLPNAAYRTFRFELSSPAVKDARVANHIAALTLPTDSNERKTVPLFRGCLRYFPAALAGVAKISKAGNDKHNPNEEMHHARDKSLDHGDCILRHLIDLEDLSAALERGATVTPEAILIEASQLAWRALALSQQLHEKFGAPLAPGAKVKGGTK